MSRFARKQPESGFVIFPWIAAFEMFGESKFSMTAVSVVVGWTRMTMDTFPSVAWWFIED